MHVLILTQLLLVNGESCTISLNLSTFTLLVAVVVSEVIAVGVSKINALVVLFMMMIFVFEIFIYLQFLAIS